MEPLIVLAAIAGLPLLWLLVTYNRLVRYRNHCGEAWSDIDTELKRRHDLIPNLVSTVRGYAAHERGLLEEVTRLRSECMAEASPGARLTGLENQLTNALGRLMVRVEAYPDLKASEQFLSLQHELVVTEDRIQAARRFFNGNVRELNNAVESFPTNLVAGGFGFSKRDFFELSDVRERATPSVSLER